MNPKYLLAAAAALSLGACSTDDTTTDPVPEKGGHKISFTIAEDSETRTTLGKDNEGRDILRWVATDQVGIFTVGQNVNSNTSTTADVNQNHVEFVGTLNQTVSPGDKFYAYYPYDEAQSADPTEVQLTIPAEQTQVVAGEYNGQSHPLVAVPMDFKWDQGSEACRINKVRFRLLGAIVEMQIYSSDEMFSGEKISWVAFESDTPLAGDFTFDLTRVTDEAEPQIEEYEKNVARTTLNEQADVPSEGGKALVYLTIAPGTYAGQFVVETDVARYTFPLAKVMEFKRAVIKGLPADLAGATREIINPDAPIRFKDDNVKRICVENWDTNKDGELSYHEAAAVTSIESQFQTDQKTSIRSFNELRFFTGLKSIREKAFNGCSGLTSITIPETVTSISGDAFVGCFSLSAFSGKYATEDKRCLIQDDGTLLAFAQAGKTEYTIPAGVTKIGEHTFEYCIGLKNIHLPDGVTAIGDYAFNSCFSLTSIAIPDTVTAIGNAAFMDCSSLTSINIPDGVTAIGSSAFSNCSSLTELIIPNGVTAIENSTFWGCSSLTEINIPTGVTTIGDYAFKGCSSLESITIPTGVTAIGYSAFENCSSLKNITIPTKVTKIGHNTFSDCSSLTEIHIPAGVTAIEFDAFRKCSSLKSVYCKPTTPPNLGNGAFLLTPSDMKIYVPADSVDDYEEAEGWREYTIVADDNQSGPNETDPIPFKDLTVMEICYNSNWDTNGDGELSYKEAAAVTDLGATFQNATMDSFNELQYFTGLTTIEADAFWGCSSLKSITIPAGVTKIGDRAFGYCIGLKSITIPDTVTAIGDYAFNSCHGLTNINIPKGVVAIGNYAFVGCINLTSITIPEGVTAIGNYTFAECSSLESITIPTSVTKIGERAFNGCGKLTSITIPDNVIEIGSYAFNGCGNLESIQLPDGLTKIEGYAFFGCISLTSITIPDNVTEIGSHAFDDCSSLESIQLPNGLTTINSGVFKGCSSLKSITIPDNATEIGSHAFNGCGKLTSIQLPNELTTIETYAFANCSSLVSITIPDKVIKIGQYCFRYCSELKSVHCKPTVPPALDLYAFNDTPSDMKIYVPTGLVKKYTEAERWSQHTDRIEEDNRSTEN